MSDVVRLGREAAWTLAHGACRGAGASEVIARSLADAIVAAEWAARPSVGLAHLRDYLAGFTSGRIATNVEPEFDDPALAVIRSDAKGGIAQLGFDRAYRELCSRAGRYGLAVFAQRNSYTTGELGYYVRRLAEQGLVAIAASNGPALMAAALGSEAVYCTNPLAFAAPVAGGPPLVIDQASSATAFVTVRKAAEKGEAIPEGWAVDAQGQPTTDASEAVKGALLAFGGARGGNIALMVEVLAAGISGANWSLDAPRFMTGEKSPGTGLFVLALKPDLLEPDFADRLKKQLERLSGKGVHIPGRKRAEDTIEIPKAVIEALERHGR
ncbi:Ldh family oxidoreductase [Labrys neptuniae]|uniref:Ldh family oxidoreductase n=1 Tax=Labrys TaxID=204476 RepID=UPI00288F38E1|nr:Ldh family oxidoreductase [Labrys neptuniae]MDT3377503.1 Ldh family oxidoreductase [Labrys neptuniae]